MKASELRIGNWVQGPKGAMYDGVQIQVTPKTILAIHSDGIELQPIPLTEEWLLKFGFKAWDNKKTIYTLERDIDEYNNTCFRFWFKQDELIFDYIQNETHPTESVFDDKNIIRLKIQHVHQLQNLYFALTNEELHENNTSQS